MIWHILLIGLLALFAGLLQGGREAFHADDEVFEERFGASDKGFWGSMSWYRKYDGQMFERVWYTPISDYWHLAKWLHKGLLIASCLLACYTLPYNIYLIGLGVYALETLGQNISYKYLRYGNLI